MHAHTGRQKTYICSSEADGLWLREDTLIQFPLSSRAENTAAKKSSLTQARARASVPTCAFSHVCTFDLAQLWKDQVALALSQVQKAEMRSFVFGSAFRHMETDGTTVSIRDWPKSRE